MKRFVFLLVAALSVVTVSPAEAKEACYSKAELKKLWRNVGGGDKKSVTSNSVHFWAWACNEAGEYLEGYISPVGAVVGDLHPGNVFDYRSGGGNAELAVADVDDGGKAPLIIDLVRYVTFLETLKYSIKIREVFDAYVEGLRGKKESAPDILKEARKTKQAGIEKLHAKYIEKKTKDNGKLDMEKLDLSPVSALAAARKAELEDVTERVKRMTGRTKVWDRGYKKNDSGSSAGMMRYWILLGSETKADLLMEAKELSRPAVDYYRNQSGDKPRIKDIVKAYSENGLDDSLYDVVSGGSRDFWVRPRKYQAIDLDDDYSDEEQKEFSIYVANWLGLAHREQNAGTQLLRAISKDEDAAKDAIEEMVRAYLKEIH